MHARENGAVALLILNFGARQKVVINFSPLLPHPPGRYTAGKQPRYPLNRGLRGGPRAGLGDFEKKKIPFFRGIRTLDRLFRSLVITPPTFTIRKHRNL